MTVASASFSAIPLEDSRTERLEQVLNGLTPEQLQWISGYTAGLAAANANSSVPAVLAAPQADPAKSLTILIGSQTGNGDEVAKQLEAEARAKGFSVNLSNLADYKPANLKREKLVTFVVSTHGEGDPPDDAELFHEFLLSKRAPKLDDLKFAVLALGDSSYINYCQTGREFDERLVQLGAERLVPLAECDLDYHDAASSWTGEVLQRLPEFISAGATVPKLHAVEAPAVHDKYRPFSAEVLVNQKITGGDSSKDVRHIELSLDGSGLRYEPGDALAVFVENPPVLVLELLDELKFDADTRIRLRDQELRLEDALTSHLEITALNLGFLKSWAELGRNQVLKDLLDDQSALAELIDTHQIIDIVRRFPATPDAPTFVDALRKLSPRSYSISSSELENPDEVHLTVTAVRYEAFGSDHWGAASTHLADRLEEGDSVRVHIEPNSRFRLPDDDATDIIMIGPGTGVAPFRAFVEERAQRNATGNNWLFFGDRNFSSDFLYQLEWQRHLKNKNLHRLDVAFSRDQREKIYVQDRIRELGIELYQWIQRGAHIYVCGDAKHMAGDVDAALVDVIAANAALSPEQAQTRLRELRRAGRYHRDVY